MFGKRSRPTGNYRFRFRSEPEDPRRMDPVRSVPLSIKQRRRRKWEMTMMVGKCLGITVAMIALISFARQVWHESMSTSPSFAVNDFNFRSNVSLERGGLSRETILEVTKLHPNLNVMSVDLAALQAALCSLPQVQDVEVQRFFPNRIDIRVNERQPLAWLACPARGIVARDSVKGRLLDADGVVFACHSMLDQYNHLPSITIPTLAWVETGKALVDSRAGHALNLLKEFGKQTWCVPLRVHDILVENDYALEVNLTDGTDVTFAMDGPQKQVQRLNQIYLWAKEHDRILATAKLIAEHNTPVTFVSRQAAPAASRPTVSKAAPPPRDAADIRAITRGH